MAGVLREWDGSQWVDLVVETALGTHAVDHQPGGSDSMAVDAVAGVGSLRTLGVGAQQAVANTDARLSNARTPSNDAALMHLDGVETVTGDKTFSGLVSGLTKTTVGLANVTNTADADKPVSTAQATANALSPLKTNNLSDLANITTARTNLGLGGAAVLAVGTIAGTVAAGDDTRFTVQPITNVFSAGGVLVAGAGKSKVYNDTGRTLTITSTRASVDTAPTGTGLIVDIHKNGTTIFTTQTARPTIAASGFTAVGGAPAVTAWASGEYLTVDIDQIGSTVAGADLTVQVLAK